jgi:hypothetical protein
MSICPAESSVHGAPAWPCSTEINGFVQIPHFNQLTICIQQQIDRGLSRTQMDDQPPDKLTSAGIRITSPKRNSTTESGGDLQDTILKVPNHQQIVDFSAVSNFESHGASLPLVSVTGGSREIPCSKTPTLSISSAIASGSQKLCG